MITRRKFLKYLTAAGAISLLPTLTGCAPECDPNTLLTVVDRTTWGAAEPNVAASNEGFYDAGLNPGGWYTYPAPLKQALNTIIIHHTATQFNNNPRAVQDTHINNDGYADIAYHFLIDKEGFIYEGRSINVRGSHTGGHNTGTIGIALFGNFENEEPTTPQLCSLKRLGIWLKVTYDLTHLAGHRDFQPLETVCPGEHLEDKLEAVAADLNLEFSTAGYVGTP